MLRLLGNNEKEDNLLVLNKRRLWKDKNIVNAVFNKSYLPWQTPSSLRE